MLYQFEQNSTMCVAENLVKRAILKESRTSLQ